MNYERLTLVRGSNRVTIAAQDGDQRVLSMSKIDGQVYATVSTPQTTLRGASGLVEAGWTTDDEHVATVVVMTEVTQAIGFDQILRLPGFERLPLDKVSEFTARHDATTRTGPDSGVMLAEINMKFDGLTEAEARAAIGDEAFEQLDAKGREALGVEDE